MGILSCFDAANGTQLWQKHDIKEVPGFHVSSSPIIVNGLAIAQLGGGGGEVDAAAPPVAANQAAAEGLSSPTT